MPVYSLLRPLLKLNSTKTHGTDYRMNFFTFSKRRILSMRVALPSLTMTVTFFTIEIPIKILAASICMIGFFCKNMAAGNVVNNKISAQNVIEY